MILIYVSYKLELKVTTVQRITSDVDDLYTSGRVYPMLAEILVFFIHPTVLTQGIEVKLFEVYDGVMVVHQLNDLLGVFMLLRVYTIVRVILNLTEYATARAFRVCRYFHFHSLTDIFGLHKCFSCCA